MVPLDRMPFEEEEFKNDPFNIDEIIHTIDDLSQFDAYAGASKEQETTQEDEPDEDNLRGQGFFEDQIQEIVLGESQHLPVHIYAKDCYNWKQMRELRLGMLEKLDTSLYENPHFSCEQMKEIRLGLLANLNVTTYAKLIYTATDMANYRKKLLAEIYELNPESFARTETDEESGIQIRISADCMTAYMTISEFWDFSVFDLKRVLSRHEVTCGILMDELEKLADNRIEGVETKVAEGTPPTHGQNGRYEYFFNRMLPESPRMRPDGSVDYTKVVIADRVNKGAVIAKYQPAVSGMPGETVTGIPIEGKHGIEQPALTGKGITRDAKNNLYMAAVDGYVSCDELRHSLNVWNVYVVNGDVNRYNGNITYDGSIHVMGSVSEMATLKASGDVIVEGFIESASITAGGNVILKKGINAGAGGNGFIHAGNKVMGNFFEYVNIIASGNVEGNYFLNCVVETDGTVIARGNKARIMGGSIKAGKAVESVNIGNHGGAKTIIDVGNTAWIDKRMIKVQQDMHKVDQEIIQLKEGKHKLHDLLGDEALEKNHLFQKTCQALQIKEEQYATLQKRVDYFMALRKSALKAYVKVLGSLQVGVRVFINGHPKEITETVSQVTIRSEHQDKK